MKTSVKADMVLLLVTLFWGISYILIDYSMTELSPFNLNALRFLIAFLAAVIAAFPKLRNVSRETLKYSALLGFILIFVYIGVAFGVKYTSVSNAGFLCSVTVVITPVLAFLFLKQKPERKLYLVLLMAFAGVALLCLTESLKPAVGDFFCLLCSFAYAVDLIVAEIAVRKENVDAFQVGVFQLVFCGVFQLILSFLFETPRLPSSPGVWVSVLVLAVFCTGLAFAGQVVAQKYTSASHVGVIFALEPVFAGVAAYFFAHEVLSGRAYFGAFLLLLSVIIMEVDFSGLKRRWGKTGT